MRGRHKTSCATRQEVQSGNDGATTVSSSISSSSGGWMRYLLHALSVTWPGHAWAVPRVEERRCQWGGGVEVWSGGQGHGWIYYWCLSGIVFCPILRSEVSHIHSCRTHLTTYLPQSITTPEHLPSNPRMFLLTK